jgi:hypothetical protein
LCIRAKDQHAGLYIWSTRRWVSWRQVAIDRQILTGPDWVARAAAGAVNDPRIRWMLRQSREVRRSYAAEVHGKPDEDRLAERWMLLQPDHVRHSYVEHVLDKPGVRARRRNRAA